MSETVYRFARWFFGMFGLIPVAEAQRVEEFETTLMMLLPSSKDRERFREGALMLAKAGVGAEQMEAIATAFPRLGADTIGSAER